MVAWMMITKCVMYLCTFLATKAGMELRNGISERWLEKMSWVWYFTLQNTSLLTLNFQNMMTRRELAVLCGDEEYRGFVFAVFYINANNTRFEHALYLMMWLWCDHDKSMSSIGIVCDSNYACMILHRLVSSLQGIKVCPNNRKGCYSLLLTYFFVQVPYVYLYGSFLGRRFL